MVTNTAKSNITYTEINKNKTVQIVRKKIKTLIKTLYSIHS